MNKPTALSQSVFFCTPIAFFLFHSTFSNNALIQRNMDNFLFPQEFVYCSPFFLARTPHPKPIIMQVIKLNNCVWTFFKGVIQASAHPTGSLYKVLSDTTLH